MPFLYQLLAAKLNQNQKHGVPKTNVEGVEDKAEEDECDNLDNVDFDHGSSPTVEQGAASCQRDHQLQREQRVHVSPNISITLVYVPLERPVIQPFKPLDHKPQDELSTSYQSRNATSLHP
ncbi:hypothetical protein PCASD_19262 [Puccinia coronata f. sp. avenae]|uniref:Uncharacterized protein n=1 Tax=Puccinia coronata f. sp. avenae TaxID=200324 RepID=A0A2N5SFN3_9BASI|nr:hypothetical protein PCASD_19262 [Puccinia coronata f. sp. avenae]